MIQLQNNFLLLISAFFTAAGCTLFFVPSVVWLSKRKKWILKRNEQRWGDRLIPRFGGLAIYLSVLLSALIWIPFSLFTSSFLVGVSCAFLLGFVDDIKPLAPYIKLIFQFLIAGFMVMSGICIELIPWKWIAIPLSIFWLVFFMNAFNLLDNMDGLAGGIGFITSAFYTIHAVYADQWVFATMGLVLSGACLGFLRYNFPPNAKIFMGDSGSYSLGLALASMSLIGSWYSSTNLLSILVVSSFIFAVPIFDTCFVMIQRFIHGQNPFRGGTDHVSHRLVILGLTVKQTVFFLYLICLFLGILSIFTIRLGPLNGFIVWTLALGCMLIFGFYLSHTNVYRLSEKKDSSLKKLQIFTQTFHPNQPVLLIESDSSGHIVLKYIKTENQSQEIVLDEKLKFKKEFEQFLEHNDVYQVLIAIPDPPSILIKEVERVCKSKKINWKVIKPLYLM